jgi:hypothetical protein
MFELVAADVAEQLQPPVLVCAEDREPRIGVACSDESGELVAQGAHRIPMTKVDDLDLAVHLRRQKP